MSEIIPKEKILKNIRKGLVTPSEKQFGDLDLDSAIYKDSKVRKEESIIEVFLQNENAFFQSFSNKFEFLTTLNQLKKARGWKEPTCQDATLTELLNSNGIATHVNTPTKKNPLITTCSKALSKPSVLIFDHRFQFVKKILSAPILIIVMTENQLGIYLEDKSSLQINALENYTRSAIHPAVFQDKEVYYFFINDTL
ncbi:MAG: hypothetical protein J5I91_09325 [Bacteroidetes bacterium]|nr:hypothetical protein [Bacteroidota bacterium]